MNDKLDRYESNLAFLQDLLVVEQEYESSDGTVTAGPFSVLYPKGVKPGEGSDTIIMVPDSIQTIYNNTSETVKIIDNQKLFSDIRQNAARIFAAHIPIPVTRSSFAIQSFETSDHIYIGGLSVIYLLETFCLGIKPDPISYFKLVRWDKQLSFLNDVSMLLSLAYCHAYEIINILQVCQSGPTDSHTLTNVVNARLCKRITSDVLKK